MNSAFFNCNNLAQIDLSSFETPNLISASLMFGNSLMHVSPRLKVLDLSNFDTTPVSEVNMNMSSMFYGCSSLKKAPELPATTLAT